ATSSTAPERTGGSRDHEWQHRGEDSRHHRCEQRARRSDRPPPCRRGRRLALGARRLDRLQSLAGDITGAGGTAIAVATDVVRCAEVKRLVDAAVEAYGRIDVM